LGGAHRGAQRSTIWSGLLLTAALSVATAMAVGCGSSSTATNTTNPGAAAPTTNPGAAAPTSTAAAPPTAQLSGTWSGHYSGAYQGTFTLTWQQAGSNLSGTIKLSAPAQTLGITGNVRGTTIRFGAVGGVTYSGSVSGNSMSGTYQVPGQGSAAGNSWSAVKTS
jgi:hypothetical protein